MDLKLNMQLVPITTRVASLHPAHDDVYAIQHYVIKFVSDLRQVNGFERVVWFSPTYKTDSNYLIEILLKVVLNTITLTKIPATINSE